ncbi:MAG: RNA polymerase sigma factor [Thermoanaerobaculia bacterium]
MTLAATSDVPPRPDSFSEIYVEHFGFLRRLIVCRFNVPEPVAEELVQDVFVSFLRVQATVRDPRAWLIGGACNAARQYWRSRGGNHDCDLEMALACHPTTNPDADLEDLARRMTVRQVVGGLHRKCRKTLELHYWQGATAREMAETLGTSPGYAEKLISRCLRKAWEEWRHLWGKTA